jgi:type I restriction enzyme S subunit
MGDINIPAGWNSVSLGEVSHKLVDGSHNPPKKKDSGLPMLSAININGNYISYEPCRFISDEEFEAEHRRTLVRAGDVLLTIVGAIGRVAVVPENHQPFTLQRSVAVIAPIQIHSRFLMYQLESPKSAKYFKENSRGTAQKGVYLKTLSRLPLEIPSLNEQHRIVAKIEELFSELDRGIESLKTAREQLKVYRQALLKQAFEGKLTEQWRKENVDRLETADQLLERIKQERETRYQQQMEAWKAAVKQWETDDKEGKKPRKPKKLQENILEQDIVNELPNLLGVGVHAPLGDLIDEPKYGTSKKCTYNTNGNGVLRIPNVVSGRVDSADLKYAEFDDSELHDYVLVDGDVLLIRSNGSVSIVGKSALIEPKDTGFIYAGYLIRLRPNANLIISKYLLFSLEAHMLRKQIEAKAKSTSGVNNINSGEIRALIIPVVGLKEQSVIVGLLEEQLSVIDSSMFNVENNVTIQRC